MQKENVKQRNAGVLMPISSLPSDCGIGTLGKGAYAFVDWLHAAGMKIWQVLPLLPTGYGDSPYQSFASDALNYYFIDFDLLEEEGLLSRADYASIDFGNDERRVDYGKQFEHKTEVLRKAFARQDQNDAEWRAFKERGAYADFALFMSLKVRFHYAPWDRWKEEFQDPYGESVRRHEQEYADEIAFWQYTQFLFLRQWNALKSYANGKGIRVMGDMPIYVAYDSVETWKYRKQLFATDERGDVSLRAGVPPDAFSEDGQFWGNPVYDWDKLKKDGYGWWKKRFAYAFTLFDIVRIDHFRAFDRYYTIPKGATTAKDGEWLDGPKSDLFADLKDRPIVAEDLGVIDDGVRELLRETGYPGMKVFVFAFDGDPENEYLPDRYGENCVAYTGTHDNETLRTFIEEMPEKERKAFETALEEYCLQADVAYVTETIEDECETIVRLLFFTKANTVIVPMQDVLAMGEEARLNAPSTVSADNWTFRFVERDFKKRKAAWLREGIEEYNR